MRNLIKILLLNILISGYLNCYSQDTLNSAYFEKRTLELYNNQNWNELIPIAEKAIVQNIDYYYLRVRIGIAFYEKKRYTKAIEHFEKALEFNPDDNLSKEYIYYSLLFSGKTFEAQQFSKTFSESLKTKLNINKNPIIKNIYLESGYSLNTDYKDLLPEIPGEQFANTQRNISNDSYFENLSLTHRLGEKTQIIHSYSGLKLNWTQQYKFNNAETQQFLHNTIQNQYFLGINIHNSGHTTYMLGAHFLWLKNNYNTLDFETTMIPNSKLFKNNETKSSERLYFIGFQSDYKYWSLGISVSLSNMNYLQQKQPNLDLTFYPFGNLNFYSKTHVSKVFESSKSDKVKSNPVLQQTFGFKTWKFWTEIHSTFGTLYDYVENNGYTIYNDVDRLKRRYGINLIIPIKKFSISIRYSYQNKEADIYKYKYNGAYSNYTYNYINQSLLLGLKFNL
ncbi:MAG: hypothetical protein A2053_04105 [Deltaproteobacteria bacterium GWA2_50_8]|nr:MAG: hypothetical protein A2053_04105 [Deltaproteobacteria bacterium GWA2_50_8]